MHKINLIKPFISNRRFCSNINVYFSPERKGVATPFIQERRYFLETTLRSTTTNNVLAIDARGQDPDPDSRGPQIYRVHLRLPFHGSFCTTSSYHRFAISLSPRADARCRGERHAAFWPARSCSKTSLTCAVRSVLFFDTLPIGFARAPPFPHRLRNSSKLRPQRHFGRASASGRFPLPREPVFTDRGLDRNDARKLAPIIRPSDRSSSCRRPTYALIDPSSSSRLGRKLWLYPEGRFDQIFFSFGRILIDWSIEFDKRSERSVLLRRILPWISKELLVGTKI